jgi:uncharacterized protein (TIGR03083 family)
VELSALVGELHVQGGLLAEAARSSGLSASVPTCPGWEVGDLVRHIGGVHRWASAFVGGRSEPWDVELEEVVGAWPADTELIPWYLEGHQRLVDLLTAADPAMTCWTFLAAPSPLAMWARRQAHETAIHRVDAEAAVGSRVEFSPVFAADGIDELLMCFVGGRARRLRSSVRHTLEVQTDDTHQSWLLMVGPEGVQVRSGPGSADCTLSGPASALYQALWNRRALDGLAVRGQRHVLELFLERVQIRWS